MDIVLRGQNFGLYDRLDPMEYIMRMYFTCDLLLADFVNFRNDGLVRNSCTEVMFSGYADASVENIYIHLAKHALKLRYQPCTQDLCRL